MREKDEAIAAEQQQLRRQVNENRQLTREKDEVIEEKKRIERQLGRVNQQLEESERVIAQFQERIAELEQQRPATDATPRSKEQSSNIKLTWKEGEKAPCKMLYSYYSAMDSNMLYVKVRMEQVYAFTISTSIWFQLPDCPYVYDCSLVVINNLLTLVGGDTNKFIAVNPSNKLFSLIGDCSGRRWTEEFPPMPTKRWGSTALCTGTTLIVAGGKIKDLSPLKTVEIMNIETKQWSTAADLPLPVAYATTAVCGDQIYILGESNMYTCSVATLIQSCMSFLASLLWNRGTGVWNKVAAPPVKRTTSVSIHGRLLAIGGKDSNEEPTSAIHMYSPTTDSWEVISYMGTPRWLCIAGVLPDNQLMVVGGFTGKSYKTETDSVESATME